jgi:hypothetical protein
VTGDEGGGGVVDTAVPTCVRVGWGEVATGVVAEGVGLTVLAGWLTVALALAGLTVGWSGLARVARAGGWYGSTTALAVAEADEDSGAVEVG